MQSRRCWLGWPWRLQRCSGTPRIPQTPRVPLTALFQARSACHTHRRSATPFVTHWRQAHLKPLRTSATPPAMFQKMLQALTVGRFRTTPKTLIASANAPHPRLLPPRTTPQLLLQPRPLKNRPSAVFKHPLLRVHPSVWPCRAPSPRVCLQNQPPRDPHRHRSPPQDRPQHPPKNTPTLDLPLRQRTCPPSFQAACPPRLQRRNLCIRRMKTPPRRPTGQLRRSRHRRQMAKTQQRSSSPTTSPTTSSTATGPASES